MRPVSNGPIRRDATRHKVLLSDGFRETLTEVEVQNYTRLLSRLSDFRFCREQIFIYLTYKRKVLANQGRAIKENEHAVFFDST